MLRIIVPLPWWWICSAARVGVGGVVFLVFVLEEDTPNTLRRPLELLHLQVEVDGLVPEEVPNEARGRVLAALHRRKSRCVFLHEILS